MVFQLGVINVYVFLISHQRWLYKPSNALFLVETMRREK